MLQDLFGWFDRHPGSYWVIASFPTVLLAAWISLSFWKESLHTRASMGRHALITGLLLLSVILAWRWPALLGTDEFNPDESQLIAGAITLEEDPVFWRSVDGTTSGPLNFYALLPTHWLGIPADYFNARLTGLLMVWIALWAGYGLISRTYGPAHGILGMVPALTFFALATDSDFIHYTSEHLSIALIMLSAFLLWKAQVGAASGKGYPRASWLLAGITMGMLPWAKLQAAPFAAFLALWGTSAAFCRTDLPWAFRMREVLLLAGAAIAPALLFVAMVVWSGQWHHFYSSYVQNNILYASAGDSVPYILHAMRRMSAPTQSFPSFLLAPMFVVTLTAVAAVIHRRMPGALFWTGLVIVAAATVAVLAPRRAFHHYLLFLILPIAWWGAASLSELMGWLDGKPKRIMLGLAFVLIGAGVPLVARSRLPVPFMYGRFEDSWRNPHSSPGKLIRELRQSGDRLAMWGWNCQIYVESQLAQATREAHSTRQIQESVQRDSYYRPRYMADLRATTPAFFIDAVGPGSFYFDDRSQYSHETFPELEEYVAEHYVLVHDYERMRVYLRKDRVDSSVPE